jgi:hypothetical protein
MRRHPRKSREWIARKYFSLGLEPEVRKLLVHEGKTRRDMWTLVHYSTAKSKSRYKRATSKRTKLNLEKVFSHYLNNKGLDYVPKHSWYNSRKYAKVRQGSSIYNNDKAYWAGRTESMSYLFPRETSKLLRKQKGKCARCNLPIGQNDWIETHHIIRLTDGGKDEISNKCVAHAECHQDLTRAFGSLGISEL